MVQSRSRCKCKAQEGQGETENQTDRSLDPNVPTSDLRVLDIPAARWRTIAARAEQQRRAGRRYQASR